jgi:hypothetical protein
MRRFRYVEPGENDEPVEHIVTDVWIEEHYFPWWQEQMRKVGKESEICLQNCIEDFIVVHWAEELKGACL